jgi:gag-polyprotein putative aspartyl protease
MPAANISNDTVGHFAYVLEDPFDLFIQKLQPREQTDVLTVAKESHALRSLDMLVDNQEYVEAIVDPGSHIIAMSEAVCHNLNLQYDPQIRLKMQLANGSVNLSLGLSRNVPARIGSITLYLQIHVIQAPAYNILLG